ncbi:MAG: ImmA/IrrE family metallo-endopeptidase [Silanimonas lenta]
MSTARHLTGSMAASHVHKWLRAWYGADVPEAVDLDVVRQMLPTTPYGQGVREIRPPVQFNDDAFEGMLARNPGDPEVWGIAYNGTVGPERQRFTIAHELGHFILHRGQQQSFNCDKESVHSGHETMRLIEREADDFASNLLMPGDRLREWISNRRIDLHVLSGIAKRFQVSFEALCIRFIKYTEQRAILVYWDNGYAKYEWRSSSAVRTRARIRRTDDPQEPLPGTLAADASVVQAWEGVGMSAAIWCPEEAPYMKLREFKHSYGAKDRVLTLLLLESEEPRAWDRSWQDDDTLDALNWRQPAV